MILLEVGRPSWHFASPTIQPRYAGICTRKLVLPPAPHSATIPRPRPRKGVLVRSLHVAVLDEELPYPAHLGQAHPHVQPALAPRGPAPSDDSLPPEPGPRRGRRGGEAFRDLGIETVVVDRAVPPKSGPGVLRPARGQSALPAALLGRHARQPRARRRGADASPRDEQRGCVALRVDAVRRRCCATRWGTNSPRRAGR